MSILIPGMEMPKNCLDCHFTDDHSAICKLLNLSVYFNVDKRAADCPLVPVPPHGRLKDADAFESELWKILYCAKQALKSAPTIIPAEEVDNGRL